MDLSSSTFAPRAETPRRHTRAGEDIAPPLPWRRVPEGGRALPADTREGLDDRGREGCGGPCPTRGRRCDDFKGYAIDKVLPVLPGPTQANVDEALCGHMLARAEPMGTDRKRRP
jgi:phosphatidylethanolamine-binding protein (PEBP) family uncharacterized protein